MKRKIKNVGRDRLRIFSRRRYGSNYSFISSVGFKQKFSDYALSFYVRNVVAVNYNRFSYVLFLTQTSIPRGPYVGSMIISYLVFLGIEIVFILRQNR